MRGVIDLEAREKHRRIVSQGSGRSDGKTQD
jgi:hypothetical protein